MAWNKSIWLSCAKATFLISKKGEGGLLLKEKIQLFLHLRICVYCKRFQQQVRFFTSKAPQAHEHRHDELSEEKKKLINEMLKD